MDLDIRPAEACDAGGIAALYNRYVADSIATFELAPVTVQEMRDRIGDVRARGLPWLLARHGEALTGYAYAGPWRARAGYRQAVESSIYLAPQAIGRGIGRRLYTTLIERLHDCDVHTVIGGIALPNPASVALHERMGFVQVAHFREVGSKFGQRVDVGYWQRWLRHDDAKP
jgi:L-amino acid N-acyltransferase YncA